MTDPDVELRTPWLPEVFNVPPYEPSPRFLEEFSGLAEAVRRSIKWPEGEEPTLPSVQDLADTWHNEDLRDEKRENLSRWNELLLDATWHPGGGDSLPEYVAWMVGYTSSSWLVDDNRELLDDVDQNGGLVGLLTACKFASMFARIGREEVIAALEGDHWLWSLVTDDFGIRIEDDKQSPHPLAPIIRGWLLRPVDVDLNRREDRILPSRLAQVQPSDRRAPGLFAPAAHVALVNGEHQALPGFEIEIEGPALPLVLYDLGEPNPHQGGGRSAPIWPLRLFVEAILGVPLKDRRRHQPVAMELTLRELRDRLYPNSPPSLGKVLRRLHLAVDALDSMDARIPWHDPTTGRGGLRRIVSVQDVPRSAAHLDDVVRVVVDLPPGTDTGPLITPTLSEWGVTSGPAYRALINLAYRWWEPGRTHFPLKGRGPWVRNWDPSAYPELTDSTAIELAFPTSANRQRRYLAMRARAVLGVLKEAGELRIVDNRILPPGPGPTVE